MWNFLDFEALYVKYIEVIKMIHEANRMLQNLPQYYHTHTPPLPKRKLKHVHEQNKTKQTHTKKGSWELLMSWSTSFESMVLLVGWNITEDLITSHDFSH